VRLLQSYQAALMPVNFSCHYGKGRINTAVWRSIFTWQSGVVEVKLVDM
jgi:hypothetical protein